MTDFDTINEFEREILKNVLDEVRARVKKEEEAEYFLSRRKFPLNTAVVKPVAGTLDNVFGIHNGQVGKIVGWDFENNYYRVCFGEHQRFTGVREEKLDFCPPDIEVSEFVKNFNPYGIAAFQLHNLYYHKETPAVVYLPKGDVV